MKNWFITGISSGLGKALAAEVIAKGDYVIGTFRNQAQVDAFNASHGDKAQAVLMDVSNIEKSTKTLTQCIQERGHIDVLVNNAGVGCVGAIEEFSDKEVKDIFEVNFFGALALTNAVLPHMRKRSSGTIVQISSHAGIKAFAGFGIYNASKFALEGMSEALAQELAPLGINVFLIEPGPFRTNFAGGGLLEAEKVIEDYKDTAGAFRSMLKNVHGKQEGNPEKAARAIIDHIGREDASLRLALGKVPLKTIGLKIDALQSDLDKNREVSASVVFD